MSASILLNPIAVVVDTVHGGLSSRKSTSSSICGIAWKLRSADRGSCAQSGMTKLLSMNLRLQYRMATRTSKGVEHIVRVFLTWKRTGDDVRSAKAPAMKEAVAIVRPMMVRYWKCQPHESFMGVGYSIK